MIISAYPKNNCGPSYKLAPLYTDFGGPFPCGLNLCLLLFFFRRSVCVGGGLIFFIFFLVVLVSVGRGAVSFFLVINYFFSHRMKFN